MLVSALPEASATARALGGPSSIWTNVEHRLADVVDLLNAISWQLAGKSSAPRPKPIERPGSAASKSRTHLTPEQIHARLQQQKRRAVRHA